MLWLQKLLIFFFISYGLCNIFKLNIAELRQDVSRLFSPETDSISNRINIAKGRKKRGRLSQLIFDTKEILRLLDKEDEFPPVCFSAIVLGSASLIFCLLSGNYMLIAPLCMIAVILPFVYIRQRGLRLKKMINEELETALSIITNSYIRTENIILSIEENIGYIHRPVQAIFKAFIFNCNYVNADIRYNLRKLKGSLNNSIFQEWCSALIACQEDSSLRFTLSAIVKKLSYVRIVSVRLDSFLYEPVREFIFMIIILLFNIPVFYVLNKSWFYILTGTVYGHFTIAVVVGTVAFCLVNVLRLTGGVEYER